MLVGVPTVGVGSKAGAFKPTSVAGCVFWFRGDLGVTQSGGTATAWADQSGVGSGKTSTPDIGTVAFNSAAINGRPGLDFTAGQFKSTGAQLAANGARTVYIVAKANDTAGGALLQFRRSSVAVTYLRVTAGVNYVLTDGVAFNQKISTALDTGPHVHTYGYDGSNGRITYALDGTSQAISGDTAVTSESGAVGFTIGGRIDASAFWPGPICEIAAFNSVLSTVDDARLMAYLKAWYGL